jgi:cytochrome c-type biogenesis protein
MPPQNVKLLVALVAGIASFASPCVLPLVPAYLGMLTGISLESDEGHRSGLVPRALLFVLGFSLLFIASGAAATVFGQLVGRNLGLLRRLGGVALVFLGLHLTRILPLPFLYRERSLRGIGAGQGYVAAFLTGAFFFTGWLPCVGPVLAAILVLAGGSDTVLQGVGLLALYCAGLGLPFVAIAVFADFLLPLLRRLNRATRWVEFASGLLVIAIGVAILLDKIALLARFQSVAGW